MTLLISPCLADEDSEKKKRGQRNRGNAATQLLTQLKDLNLTDDQVAKVKELHKESLGKAKEIRETAGITPELVKKRAEVQKKLRGSDKKGKELLNLINSEAGYNKEQIEATAKINALRLEMKKKVVALCSDEQKAKIPANFIRGTKNAKKDAAEKTSTKKKNRKQSS